MPAHVIDEEEDDVGPSGLVLTEDSCGQDEGGGAAPKSVFHQSGYGNAAAR